MAAKIQNIEIRGVTYADTAAAARALGVQAQTVCKAARAGTLDRVGLGCAGYAPMPITIRGVKYPDADAAARAFGVTRGAIYQALHRGRIDRVGLPPEYNHARSQPVVIAGVRYPSKRSASLSLGCCDGYVSQVMRQPTRRRVEGLLGAAMRVSASEGGRV